MHITEQGLQEIEKTADKHKNVNLLFMVQILREVRELKKLLEEKQDTCNCGNSRTNCTK